MPSAQLQRHGFPTFTEGVSAPRIRLDLTGVERPLPSCSGNGQSTKHQRYILAIVVSALVVLTLHLSDPFELLLDSLIDRLVQSSTEPLFSDTVIVAVSVLSRQLMLAIASRAGVCAIEEFSFPARWLRQQVARLARHSGGQLRRHQISRQFP